MQSNFENMDDQKLIKLAKKGNKEAFEQLICRYQDKVYNLALRYLNNNKEDATDVSQDVFLAIYKNLKSFRGQSLFSTWVYRVTVNKCIDFIRKVAAVRVYSLNQNSSEDERKQVFEPAINDPLSEKIKHEQRRKYLYQALREMDERQRRLIILRDFQGLGYAEIGEILNIPKSRVGVLILKARMALRAKLENIPNFSQFLSSK